MKRTRIILLAILAIASISAEAAKVKKQSVPEPEYKTEYDVPYYQQGDIYPTVSVYQNADAYQMERCRVDVYYPTRQENCPIVIWFHGGGLSGGNKFIPKQLQESGLVVVAANYRLMPNVDISDCIRDAAACVAWTIANAERYHGDKHKVIVAGHSAGGFLTSMVGLDKQWLAPYSIDPDSLAALAPYSGQAITHFGLRRQQGISDLTPTLGEYAPLSHVRKGIPPMLIISGDREMEMVGRYEEQAYFWRMLKLNGNERVELYEIQGYDHGAMAEPAHHILKNFIRKL